MSSETWASFCEWSIDLFGSALMFTVSEKMKLRMLMKAGDLILIVH